ncbi:MAG: glycoside hydrolase family 28 protein [Planctomycetaceae bacterium]|nr:glycoside hydrolase family 28 protein [Planctomycetaceae bacterium]
MRTSPIRTILAMSLCLGVAASCLTSRVFAEPSVPPGHFDVRNFGAAGDGVTLDTKAIQKAIDTCAEAGGGKVCLQGGTFLSGTLRLKSNVTLHVEAGATLLGSTNIEDYPDITPEIIYLYRARFTKYLIYAEHAENIGLSGRGVISGQGTHFPAQPGDDKGRPYILRFSECSNVRVENLTFLDSARWLSHYLACDNVTISGITIRAKIRENRDGIDVDSCQDVRISDCRIDTGDDVIVLKATTDRPCRRVTITNCVLSSMASAVKMGTESNGGFEDIAVTNCVIHDTGYSGIAVEMVDGGELNRVTISNITMRDVKAPIFIRLGNRARPIPELPPPGMGSLRNVIISDVQATGADTMGCSITGIPGFPVENVTLDNIRIESTGGGTLEDAQREIPEKIEAYPSGKMFGTLPAYGFFCRHATNLRLHNIDLSFEEEDQRPAIICDDVQDLDIFGLRTEVVPAAASVLRFRNVQGALIHGYRSALDPKDFLKLEGDTCRDIEVRDR